MPRGWWFCLLWKPITKSWQVKFNLKKGNDLCAVGLKKWQKKESLHTFHFFEIRPIIFSLAKNAKLGRLICSKQKIIERYIMEVLSTAQTHVLKSPWKHRNVYYVLPKDLNILNSERLLVYIFISLMRQKIMASLNRKMITLAGVLNRERPKGNKEPKTGDKQKWEDNEVAFEFLASKPFNISHLEFDGYSFLKHTVIF